MGGTTPAVVARQLPPRGNHVNSIERALRQRFPLRTQGRCATEQVDSADANTLWGMRERHGF
jgi:hypothetical protein